MIELLIDQSQQLALLAQLQVQVVVADRVVRLLLLLLLPQLLIDLLQMLLYHHELVLQMHFHTLSELLDFLVLALHHLLELVSIPFPPFFAILGSSLSLCRHLALHLLQVCDDILPHQSVEGLAVLLYLPNSFDNFFLEDVNSLSDLEVLGLEGAHLLLLRFQLLGEVLCYFRVLSRLNFQRVVQATLDLDAVQVGLLDGVDRGMLLVSVRRHGRGLVGGLEKVLAGQTLVGVGRLRFFAALRPLVLGGGMLIHLLMSCLGRLEVVVEAHPMLRDCLVVIGHHSVL